MSKQDFIVQILVTNEVQDGTIDQTLYDFIVEELKAKFRLSKAQAKRSTLEVLRALYMVTA